MAHDECGTVTQPGIVFEAMKKAEKPVRPQEVVTMTGLSKEEVSQVTKELKKKGEIISPKRCYYASIEQKMEVNS